jgi:hypothetical protein
MRRHHAHLFPVEGLGILGGNTRRVWVAVGGEVSVEVRVGVRAVERRRRRKRRVGRHVGCVQPGTRVRIEERQDRRGTHGGNAVNEEERRAIGIDNKLLGKQARM